MENSQPSRFFETALRDTEINDFINTVNSKKVSDPLKIAEAVNRPKVLMYHRVVEDETMSQHQDTCLHVEEFNRHLEFLDRMGYTPITFKDYWLFQQNELQLPKKPVILTFDDGYLDTHQLAFPLLREYGMKAVVFVLGDRSLDSNIWDADTKNVTTAPLMGNEHILELHDNGFEIGTHTLSHANLITIPEEDCYREIYKPKVILETLLGVNINSISYPYGRVNQHIKNQVFEAGYRFACSVFSGPAQFGMDPLEIRRITVHNTTSMAGFAMRLVAPYEYIEWMWWKTRNG